MHFKMIILYEWRDLIEKDDYLVALQALAILQVRYHWVTIRSILRPNEVFLPKLYIICEKFFS